MNYDQLQKEILTCLRSETLKAQIEARGHVFTEKELLGIAFHYAPSFAERLRLLQLLADHAPTVTDHAEKCIQWQKNCLERFKRHGVNELYELCIKDSPDAYEERYLCSSFETALEMIDGFYKEYDFVEESSLASYIIKKRKVLCSGEPFAEDHMGECALAAGKILVSVDSVSGESEFGPCHGACADCRDQCIGCFEVCFPSCIADRAPARYSAHEGKIEYGIHLDFSTSEMKYEYYIIPFEGTMMESGDYDEQWGGHWHEHIPAPHAEEVSVEDLPTEFRKRYDRFVAWLNDHFTENYKRKKADSESTT